MSVTRPHGDRRRLAGARLPGPRLRGGRLPGRRPPRAQRHGAGPRGFELYAAVLIGLATMAGATLTYLAVRMDGDASGADKQSVLESVLVQRQQIGATLRTQSLSEIDADYRTGLAEAAALADADEAWRRRAAAQSLLQRTRLGEFLVAKDGALTFDATAAYQVALHDQDFFSVPPDQPQRSATEADDLHLRSLQLGRGALGELGVVVLLTFARVTSRHRLRLLLGGIGGAAAVGVLGYALLAYS